MTKIIYSVLLDQTANLGTCLFENVETARVYAKDLAAQGLKPLVVSRVMICDEPAAFLFKSEVSLAS